LRGFPIGQVERHFDVHETAELEKRIMKYRRMPIEVESPEELGYETIRYNLSESSTSDRTIAGLGLTIPNLTLLYNEHRGDPALRAAIAAMGTELFANDVLITAGAAGALFIVATALLGPGDELVVVRPNYATNLETPRAIGCAIRYFDLAFEEGFRIDPDTLAKQITPRTKLVSITLPHNPTGVTCSEEDLRAIIGATDRHGCRLLVDETYRDLAFGGHLPVAASLSENVISVASLSKAYGVPGIRVGWLISRNAKLQEIFLAAKEQISISGSVIDEWVALQVLTKRKELLAPVLDEMTRRRALVTRWLEQEQLLEWVQPSGGVVCMPRMRREPRGGTEAFYKRLLAVHGTYVGPGHWFEMPDTYFRLGYGWPSGEELEKGLAGISNALRG
jgi:aspartate/methionine/tyrosine aminotransferase